MNSRDRYAIQSALDDALRAQRYVMQPDVFLCMPTKCAMGPEREYRNASGATISPVAKDIGSEFCLLDQAIRKLARLLARGTRT